MIFEGTNNSNGNERIITAQEVIDRAWNQGENPIEFEMERNWGDGKEWNDYTYTLETSEYYIRQTERRYIKDDREIGEPIIIENVIEVPGFTSKENHIQHYDDLLKITYEEIERDR